MVNSAHDENYSFSDTKYQRNALEEGTTLLNNNAFDENTIIFNDKMDECSSKSSQSTICDSNSNVIVGNNSEISAQNIKEIAKGIQNSRFGAFGKEIICKGFEYRTAETTVINTITGVSKVPTFDGHINSNGIGSDASEKSKVVVQILTSNTKPTKKPQTVVENKSAYYENQNNHSFRDDVFKILSKSQSTTFKFEENSKENTKLSDSSKDASHFESESNTSRKPRSSKFGVKKRRKSYKNFENLNENDSLATISCQIKGLTGMYCFNYVNIFFNQKCRCQV